MTTESSVALGTSVRASVNLESSVDPESVGSPSPRTCRRFEPTF